MKVVLFDLGNCLLWLGFAGDSPKQQRGITR
jgi:hypothetical protein